MGKGDVTGNEALRKQMSTYQWGNEHVPEEFNQESFSDNIQAEVTTEVWGMGKGDVTGNEVLRKQMSTYQWGSEHVPEEFNQESFSDIIQTEVTS